MAKVIKDNLTRALIFFVIFSLTTVWWFSGWPKILQNPPIPPEVQKAEAASGDIILLWDTANGAVPTGWSCISCSTSSALYGAFIRASSTYSIATSGADTHTPTLTYSSAATGTSAGKGNTSGATLYTPFDSHTHSWISGPTANSGDVRPPFQNLNIIAASNTVTMPANVIAIFDTTYLPPGWTRYATSDSYYLRGYSNNATSGAATHTHTTNSTTSSQAAAQVTDTGSGATAELAHAHTIGGSTSLTSANNNLSYVGVIFAYNSSGGTATASAGMIAMFDAAPPTGWTSISGSSPWAGNFLVGSSTFGVTGGSSADHNHGGSVVITSGAANALNRTIGTASSTAPGGIGSGNDHTHNVTYTVSSAGSLPVYRDVILGKRNTVLTVNTGGTQTASMDKSSSNNSVGGYFSFVSNATSTKVSVSQIIISETASINANTNLSNADLYYDTDSPCSYGGNETLFGTAASFSASEKATITGTMSVGTTTTCVYAVLDVGSGPSANDKLDIEISTPSTEVTVLPGEVSPATAVAISGQTNIAASVTCTTPLTSTVFGTIDNTAIYAASPESTTTVTTDSSTGFNMTAVNTTCAGNSGLCNGTNLITLLTATGTLTMGGEGYGAQATTTSGNGINIDPRYWWATSTNIVGNLSLVAKTVASSSAGITSQLIIITYKAAVSASTTAGSYTDTVTYSCSVNP